MEKWSHYHAWMCMSPGNRQNSNGQTPSFRPGAIKKMVWYLTSYNMQWINMLYIATFAEMNSCPFRECIVWWKESWWFRFCANQEYLNAHANWIGSCFYILSLQVFAWKLANQRYNDFKMALPTYHTPAFRVYWPICSCSQGFRRFWAWSRCATWYETSG